MKMYCALYTTVGISETATTCQVAVQTPPSRRKGPCNAHTQTRLAKRMKKYENGIDSEQTDAKSRSQNNQITPEGNFFGNYFITLKNYIT
jgi:hypothetical protein